MHAGSYHYKTAFLYQKNKIKTDSKYVLCSNLAGAVDDDFPDERLKSTNQDGRILQPF
jgi:hypothetical protein